MVSLNDDEHAAPESLERLAHEDDRSGSGDEGTITVDAPVWGTRERDVCNHFHVPEHLSVVHLVRRVLEVMHAETSHAMALAACPDHRSITRDLVERAS